MCLYIGKNSSFIAKSDITVYKVLIKTSDGGYVTPSQNYPVKLDNMLIPEEIASVKPYGFKYCIKEGAIHAYTSSNGRDSRFRAIIKKGTKFWIQDDLKQIAAEKLYITSEVAGEEETDFSDYLEEGVDVYLKDGRRCKLTNTFNKNDVIGIYGYNNQIIATEYKDLQLSKEYPLSGNPNVIESYSKAQEDLDGYGNTKQLKSLGIKSEALDYCEALGKDWYIPALGQIKKVAENLLRINFTLKYLRKEPLPLGWFWSSTLESTKYAWGCCSNGCYYWDYGGFCYGYVDFRYYVLPFLELS